MDLRTQQPTRLGLELLPRWLDDDRYVAEEKFDGHRVTVLVHGGRIDPRNRHGSPYKARPLTQPVAAALGELPGLSWLDGELCDDRYLVFDLRVHDGQDLHAAPWRDRRAALDALGASHGWDAGPVALSRVAHTAHDRITVAKRVLDSGGEGVVLKRADAPYTPGRTTTWRKAKYTQLLHAVAGTTSTTGQTTLLLYDEAGAMTRVGTAACYERPPRPGAPIDVRYRPTTTGGLQEAVVIDTDSDADPSTCRLTQLRALRPLRPRR
jgi:ATP-dependent DNA ligase